MMQTPKENVYTLVIADKAVLAFAARNLQEAQSLAREVWLRDDLREMKSQGRALWDGKAPLRVRLASDAERRQYEQETEALPPDPDELAIVYLVELH